MKVPMMAAALLFASSAHAGDISLDAAYQMWVHLLVEKKAPYQDCAEPLTELRDGEITLPPETYQHDGQTFDRQVHSTHSTRPRFVIHTYQSEKAILIVHRSLTDCSVVVIE